MKQVTAWLLVALLLGGSGSCSEAVRPVAGVLTLSLTTPNPSADAAILLTVTGPSALTSAAVPSASNLELFAQPLSTTTRFALTGTLTNGAILTIGVADARQAPQYTATIQSVAAVDFQLRAVTGYSITVSQ
jgi:hypothetical protein